MQKLLLFTLLLISHDFLYGQNIDFVDKKLDSIQDINEKINFLNDWTGKNYKNFPEEAQFYSEKCLDLAKTYNNYSGTGDALIRIGLIQRRKGNYTQTLKLYEQALVYYKIDNDSIGLNKTLLNRGGLYISIEKYQLALEDYFKSLEFFESNKDYEKISNF